MQIKNTAVVGKLLNYFNPFKRIGVQKYSFILPFMVTLLAAVLTEFITVVVRNDPGSTGLITIFLFIAIIVYFSLRDGIKGGFTATIVTISYYLYIVFTRQSATLGTSLRAVALFGLAYFIIAGIIGWLRKSVDQLIEREANDHRRLVAVLHQLPVGVIISDKNGTIEMANKQADKILGIKVPIGHTVDKGYFVKTTTRGKPAPSPKALLGKLINKGKPIIQKEYEIYRPDGKKIYLQASSSIVRGYNREIIAIASIFNDITDQKETEFRKDDFVNMASHELKTPITSLKLYIGTLASHLSLKNVNASKAMTGINHQIERLQKLVSALLDVSRLQTGRLTFDNEEFKLEELIKETINSFEGSNKKGRIEFKSKTSTVVLADRIRISQVINNFITNAIKYSPEKAKIIVKTKKLNGQITVSVKDYGIGIDKSKHKKIFERLYQVTDKYEKTFPGLGMGLYIAKEIITNQRGKIWVESRKGKGSTFYFRLPIVDKK